MAISRDARKILNTIKDMGGANVLPIDIINAEILSLKYYSKTVSSIIKEKYPKAKSDPNRVRYYFPILESYKKGIRNRGDLWNPTSEQVEAYWIISEYLLVDFSYEDLKLVKELCMTYAPADLKEGVRLAEKEEVHSVHYLHRIVESYVAERNKKEEQRKRMRELCSYKATNDITNRSRIELATLKHEWKNDLENMELQKKWEGLENE